MEIIEVVKNLHNTPGLKSLCDNLGIVGTGLSLGVTLISSLAVIAEKGFVEGIKSLWNEPTEHKKRMNELFIIQSQVSGLGHRLSNLFDQLSMQIDLNSAK